MEVRSWRSASYKDRGLRLKGCGKLVAGILTGLMVWMLTELVFVAWMDRYVREFPSVSGLFVRLKLAVLIRFPGFPDLFVELTLC